MTQKLLSELLGVNEKTVSKWERGINAPDIATLPKLSELLDVSINELVMGEKDSDQKNINNNDSVTVETIKFYNKKYKFNCLKYIAIFLILILSLFAVIFTINNFNRYKVFSISSGNSDFEVDGYIIFNQENNIITLKPLLYSDDYVGTSKELKTMMVTIELLYNNKVIYNETKTKDSFVSINSLLSDSIIFLEENISARELVLDNEQDIENFEIKISYSSNKINEINEFIIPLKVNKVYSNNKLFYKNTR